MSRISGSNPRTQGKNPRSGGAAGGKRKLGTEFASLFKANAGSKAGALAADHTSLKKDSGSANADQANGEQRRAVNLAESGQSFFLTGGAGTGKSFTLRLVVKALQAQHGVDRVFVTASTGIAACHIGGTTLHSFAGIGLGKESVNHLCQTIFKRKTSRERWYNCEVLIIDEVSMLDAALFDKLEELARMVRGNERPFGGIQLILCGDFFQLPPVRLGSSPGIAFIFDAHSWSRVVPQTVLLRTVIRQKDQSFVDLLNAMRRGKLSPFHIQLLKLHHARRHEPLQATCEAPSAEPAAASTAAPAAPEEQAVARPGSPAAGRAQEENPFTDFVYDAAAPVPEVKRQPKVEIVTKLFPQNAPADNENKRRLAELAAQTYCYTASEFNGQQMEGCIAMSELHLKEGAQVICIKNLTPDIVNGSRGLVVGFQASAPPLKVAAVTDPATGRSCTAWLKGPAQEGGAAESGFLYPLVEFERSGGGSVRQLLVPQEWTVESGGMIKASRVQVPLRLAWALSIHKSQGMTLSAVEVDLAQCFEPGHAYVALSRSVSLETTRLLSFLPEKVFAHPKVCAFYESLEREQGSKGGGEGAVLASLAGQVSEEQRIRMEANRQRALANRQQALLNQAGVSGGGKR